MPLDYRPRNYRLRNFVLNAFSVMLFLFAAYALSCVVGWIIEKLQK